MSTSSKRLPHPEETEIHRDKKIRTESSVSPVVGVMLMLTITLILAAIISGMTGGIAQTQKKPPGLLMDASLVISPSYNSLDISIVSVSEAIPTRDLKFITEWRNGTSIMRNTVTYGSGKVMDNSGKEWRYPIGLIVNTTSVTMSDFGDYSLLPGTRIFANTTNSPNSLKALFTTIPPAGSNVKIQFVHVPSGAIIAEKELTVEEG